MKKTVITLAAASAALALASCGSGPAKPQFSIIETNRTFRENASAFELDYRFEYLSWCADEAVAAKIEVAMISDFFGPEFIRTSPMDSAKAFDENVADIHGRRADGEEEFRWDGYLKMRSYADVLNDRIVGYTIERSDFTGGAHGMETTACVNYDLRTGDRIGVDDLFTPEGVAALAGAIRARILKDHHKSTWAELVGDSCFFEEGEVLPVDNFRLTATHITFIYNPYDIACYANGGTKVKLPLAELTGFREEAVRK